MFCKKTIKMIKQLIESYFENETFLEMVKEDFFNSPMFNLEKIFDLIDYDNDGFISLYDVFSFYKIIFAIFKNNSFEDFLKKLMKF